MAGEAINVLITDPVNVGGAHIAGVTNTAPVGAGSAGQQGLIVRDWAEQNPGTIADEGHPGIVQVAKCVTAPSPLASANGYWNFLTLDGKGALWTSGYTIFQSDTYTATGTGTEVDFKFAPFKYYALQVTPTGAVTSWTALLQLSLDGVGWSPMISHTNVTPGAGIMIWSAVQATGSGPIAQPAMFARSRVSALVLGAGTNVVTRWIACP